MALAVQNLTKDYPTRSGPLSILRGICLDMNPGDAVAIMGPSGSGKSTLLQILGTLDRPSSGSIRLKNIDPFILQNAALARFRNQHIGFVFQDHHLLPQFNVFENVVLPALVTRESVQGVNTFARQILDRVGLTHRIGHRPAELSGGERQRVAIARAMVLKPSLILADEPTGNLDRGTANAVSDLLLDLHRQENNMLITVTHSSELAARFQRRFVMDDGTLHAAT